MTTENVVYIPTVGRLGNIKKIVPYWTEQDINVRLVVERYEYNDHAKLKREMRWGEEVVILTSPLAGRGIGYVRNFIVKHAKETKQTAVIISEDDMRPIPNSDMVLLLDEVDKPDVLGVGAVRSIHDRFTGGMISKLHGPVLCPGAWGFMTFAVNVDLALQLGNFEPRYHTLCDDLEMALKGIAAGIPWRVHCDAKVDTLGTRYAPGGINTRFSNREKRTEAERECWAIFHKKWPDFTTTPDKRPRVSWQKALNHYIPEWKEYSALHEGSLEAYDNYQPEEES